MTAYYVRFVDFSGTVLTGDDGQEWFGPSDVGFGFTHSPTIIAGTTFEPLTLTLSASTEPQLARALFEQNTFKQIEVAAYSGGATPTLMDDYSFFNFAAVSGVAVDTTGFPHVTVDYQEVQQTHYHQAADGSVQPQSQSHWDATKNSTGGIAPIAAPIIGAPPANGSHEPSAYYVRFVDFSGNALTGDDGREWFSPSDVGFGFTHSPTIVAGTTFEPLTLTLDSSTGPQLARAMFEQDSFTQIEVAGYSDGSTPILMDDYMFGGADVSGVAVDITGLQHVTVDYQEVQQTHYHQAADGSVQPQSQSHWDATKNSTGGIAPIAAPIIGAPPANGSGEPSAYYVRFVNSSGSALTGDDGQEWFSALDLGFSLTHSPTIAAGSTFEPLTLTLDSSTGPQLARALFEQDSFTQIEVAGYSDGSTPILMDDYSFGVADVIGVAVDPSGLQHVSVDYQEAQQTHYHQAADGSVQPQSQSHWDATKNSTGGIAPIAAPQIGAPAANGGGEPSAYYVRFVDFSGTVLTGDDGQEWFSPSDVGFGFTHSPTIVAGTTFEPLTLTLDASTGPQLARAMFEQDSFTQIEVAGYSDGSTPILMDDYMFGGADVSSVAVDTTGLQHVTVDYQEVQQKHYHQATDGSVQERSEVSWDAMANSSGGFPPIAASHIGAPAANGSGEPSAYYVRFVDFSGNALTGDDGQEWFSPSDVGFGFTHSPTIVAGTTFEPLTLTLDASTGPQLARALFEQDSFTQIEVAGYSGGSTPILMDDYMFGFADISGVAVDTTGLQHVTVDYQEVQQKHYHQATDGSVQERSEVSWDAMANSSGGFPPIAASHIGAPAANGSGEPSAYYVRFVDFSGNALTGDDGQEWFSPSDVGFGFTHSPTIVAGTTFEPLTLTLDASTGPQLARAMFEQDSFTQIEVAGYSDGSTPILMDDYMFGGADVSSVAVDTTGLQHVTVDYQEFQQIHYHQAADGSVQERSGIGWDASANDLGSFPPITAPLIGAPPANGSVPCITVGTRIATAYGAKPVEHLCIGDPIATLSGRMRPVVWIGERRIDCRSHPCPQAILPVRIQAGAFAVDIPTTDLFLSPDHAVFADGVLIPIKYLVNGTTIRQMRWRKSVHYFHVELDRHDVMLAEGLAVESYLDTGDRSNFVNGGTVITLHSDFASRAWEAVGCAPLTVAGPRLELIRNWLVSRSNRLADNNGKIELPAPARQSSDNYITLPSN